MKAIAKTRPAPGVEVIEAPEPRIEPGKVKIKLEAASVCGTDLHIHRWDAWSSSRIVPPRIIGHEFCGTIVEVGEGVAERSVGQFVASESHIVCGTCKQCLHGQGHVCVNTQILGVDVDGGFAEYVVVPFQNARVTSRSVPPRIAAFQDALGNAVHTAAAGPLEDATVLITGMGPIGLFAVSVCRALGARTVVGTEISPYRMDLARQVGVDAVVDPRDPTAEEQVRSLAPDGYDACLEMSGHPGSLALAIRQARPGGRISLLGVFGESEQKVPLNQAIFKGLDLQCIVGRRLWDTWELMGRLLEGGRLVLDPVVTHEFHYTEFAKAMDLLEGGNAGKVVFLFD